MAHGMAVNSTTAKKVLALCIMMPVVALGARLYSDPLHHRSVSSRQELSDENSMLPPHVPPPLPASVLEHRQQRAQSS
ncbi:unnamed protein product [Sphagnum balticum]